MNTQPARRRLVASFLALATATTLGIGLTSGSAQADDDGDNRLRAKLTGAAEVPGPGDPDGKGRARVYGVSAEPDIICADLRVKNIDRAAAAHIHVGSATVAGPVVVALTAPIGGRSRACTVASATLVADILANPANYYVNVHTAPYPAGAVRGQLS